MSAYAKAEPLLLQALEIDKKTLGEEHPSYATSLGNLASADIGVTHENNFHSWGNTSRASISMACAVSSPLRELGVDTTSLPTPKSW